MITYFAADLIWASRIKGLADALGLAARPVRSVDMLEARLGDSPVGGLVVDLDAPETALTLIRAARDWESRTPAASRGACAPRLRIVAFGPHGQTQDLQAAAQAGADQVLTRGAFHEHTETVLRAVCAGDK